MHIGRSNGDDDAAFSHTSPNDNPTICPSRRPSTRDGGHVEDDEELGGGIEGVEDEEPQHAAIVRRKSFFSFAFNANKGSFVSAVIITVLGVYKLKLGHDMKDDEELREGAYTICAVMLFVAAISMISYCDYLNPDPNIVMLPMVKRAQEIVQIPAFFCELFMYILLIIIHSTVKEFKNLPIMPPAGFMYIPILKLIAIRSFAAGSETLATNMKLRKVAQFQLIMFLVTRGMNLMAEITPSNSLPFTPGLLLWADLTLVPASAIAIYIGRHTDVELHDAERPICRQMWLSVLLRAGIQAVALAVMLFTYKRPIFSALIFSKLFGLIDKPVLRSVNRSTCCILAGIAAVSIGIHFIMLKYFMKLLTAAVEEPSDWRHLAISLGVGCLGTLVNFVPLPECVASTQPPDEELGAGDQADPLELGSVNSFMSAV